MSFGGPRTYRINMSEALRISTLPPLGSLPLARVALDRGGASRTDPQLLDRLWSAPGTKVMFISDGRAPVAENALVLRDSASVSRPDNPVYLGRTLDGDPENSGLPAGTHIMLSILDEVDPAILPDEGWVGLRAVAASLPPRDAGLFVQAAAISNWHSTHQHCPRCGGSTIPEEGGWVRRCVVDGTQHFPRTDPAIIATVTDGQDRLLLGSSASWPDKRFSTLAGFVEPGESLEAAVIREIAEESGIEVHSPKYLGSQPWPFPASLMLGFTAVAVNTNQVADGVEIREVQWFSRSELFEAVRTEQITVAGNASIARSLIEHWYGGPLDEEPAEGRP